MGPHKSNVTVRGFWRDPYETRFTATCVDVWRDQGETLVVLDYTDFYPESGGQPWDTGRMAAGSETCTSTVWYEVTRVIEEGGQLIHVLKGDALSFAKGTPVVGEINWARRFDHMQQHTGQHILSRAFEKVVSANTVGFHMSDEYVSIDLDVKNLTSEQTEAVEELANDVVFRNLEVMTKEYSPDAIPVSIRDRVKVHLGTTRVVFVGDFDACACGGTHVKRTGEIGVIKVHRIDRAHGGIRIFFSCGLRTLNYFRKQEKIISEACAIIQQAPDMIPSVLSSLQDKVKMLDKERQEMEMALAEMEVEKLLREESAAEQKGQGQSGKMSQGSDEKMPPTSFRGQGVLLRSFRGKSAFILRIMAQKISERSKKVCILFSKEPVFNLVVAVPSEAGDYDARVIADAVGKRLGARGGGNSKLAQLGTKQPLSLGDQEIYQEVLSSLKGLDG